MWPKTSCRCAWRRGRPQRRFENRENGWRALTKWLKTWGEVWVALEATGTYGDGVSDWLYQAGQRVSVVNPARIHAYAQSQLKRHKTDAVDAELIADSGRSNHRCGRRRAPGNAVVRHRDDLKGLRQPRRTAEAQPPSATVVRHLHALVELLERQIAEAEAQIRNHIDRHPDLKRSMTCSPVFPVGDQTPLLAELGFTALHRCASSGGPGRLEPPAAAVGAQSALHRRDCPDGTQQFTRRPLLTGGRGQTP